MKDARTCGAYSFGLGSLFWRPLDAYTGDSSRVLQCVNCKNFAAQIEPKKIRRPSAQTLERRFPYQRPSLMTTIATAVTAVMSQVHYLLSSLKALIAHGSCSLERHVGMCSKWVLCLCECWTCTESYPLFSCQGWDLWCVSLLRLHVMRGECSKRGHSNRRRMLRRIR